MHKFLSHTADVKFQAEGKTLEQAFGAAAVALHEVIVEKMKINAKIKKKIHIKGKDKESLLHNFLEEFLFLLDAEDFIFKKVSKIKINKKIYELEAEVSGDKASRYKISNDVKAITYNEMFIKKDKNKYKLQVVLDV